ncbi:WD domain-containing protein [Caballeronia cordobensis]|uniref:WD domain-containing protein n=1 Tax=Caballeronia cordobensis TaxID=1353886 RepID=A0A158I513_CABCO|nr:TIR domain-containing protein [Caballeronia cordobensis]SAL51110.1 WD domain-containing protein [Caballeronia cordobensis]
MSDTFEFDVFLSYHWRDHAQVEALARRLYEAGVRPFLDRWYLVPGTNWLSALENTLAHCKSVAVCLGAEMGPWQQREQYSALERQVAEERRGASFPVIPVLLPGADAPLGFLKQNTWVDFRPSVDDPVRFRALIHAIQDLPPGPEVESVVQQALSQVCPYRGLLYFREQDAAFYYGREAAIDQLAAMIAHHPLVAVVGASGSGKSSVVRAGLLPRLRAGRSPVWEIATLMPTDRPLHALSTALLPLLEPEMSEVTRLGEITRLADRLGNKSIALRDVISRILEKQPGTGRLMLVVDQWEELFTLTTDEGARQRFIDEVLEATLRAQLSVVLTVRGDFFGRAITGQRALSDRLQGGQVNLGPMIQDELRQAMEKPAAKAGLRFQPGLVQRVLDDAGDEPGNLPLMEFVLQGLWERRQGGMLLHDAYDAIGQLQGAVAQKADEIVSSLSLVEQQAVRRIFLQLAQPGEGDEYTRRRVTLAAIGSASLPIAKRLADERLLVTSPGKERSEATVEVSHEALIHSWGQLKDWLDEDREFLLWRKRFSEMLAAWRSGKQEGRLLRDAFLSEAQRWLSERAESLNDEEREYIGESVALRDREFEAERARQKRELEQAKELAEQAKKLAEVQQKRADEQVAARAEREKQLKQIAEEQARVRKEQARTGRAQRRVQAMMGVIAVILVLTGGWIIRQTREVGGQSSLLLAVAAEAAADGNVFDQALRLAVLAARSSWLHPSHPAAGPSLSRAADTSTLRILINRHTDRVYSAGFNPDGKRVVTASEDGTARIWDAETGKPLSTPMTHGNAVLSASFSPDGKRVVTVSYRTTRVWDADTGKPLGAPMTHGYAVLSASFSPDGKRVVTASLDMTARVWDADTGEPLGAPMTHGSGVISANFSPDGTRVVTASTDNTARVWDADTGKPLGAPMTHGNRVVSASFSPDGRRVVTASLDMTAGVWDADTGKPLRAPMAHGDGVSSASFSPDGKRVVTASWDMTARVWDADTGKPLGAPMTHDARVSFASFSPDGKRVITASWDMTARVWDADTGRPLGAPMTHGAVVLSASFSPDGKRVVTASADKTARVWDADIGESLGAPMTHGGVVTSANFSPDGKRVVTASDDFTAVVWDTDGKPLGAPMAHDDRVISASFSPDGKRVVTASGDKTARVWDADTGKPVGAPMTHDGPVRSASFSPDGKRVVTASWDETARVWDADTGKPLGAAMTHGNGVSSARFSPDGKRVVTASADKTARVWDADTGKPLGALMMHGARIISASFSDDGKRVLTVSWDKTARVWDADTGRPLGAPMTHGAVVLSAGFSPDGKRVVTASEDKTARVWDVETGKPIGEPMTHGAAVYSASFSPDGKRVVTASEDKTARVWDADTGKPLGKPMTHGDAVTSASFSPDGKRVVTASHDETARVWDAYWPSISRATNLIDEVCQRKLHGEARKLTEADVRAARILSADRIGEDVCVDAS